jgi:hypothetical protein
MEHPEGYLHFLAAPLASAREGNPLPVARFSLEAVANAFVILGLLPAARAGEILAAQRPVLQAAGFRVGLEIGELSVSRAARDFQEARAAATQTLRSIPLAIAAGPVRCQLRASGLAITSATLTPEGILVRYYGDAREIDRHGVEARSQEIAEQITELSITDDTGETYLVPAGTAPIMSGRRSVAGRMLWAPVDEFLAVPSSRQAGSRGREPAVRWLEFSAGSGRPARVEVLSSAAVLTGTTEPPWPTPAECYLAQVAPPARDFSIGSRETGTVELDTGAIVAAVAGALLAVGAVPPDSALLAGLPGSVRSDWRLDPSERQVALMDPWAPGPASSAGLTVRLPFEQATAVIENITAREDMVSVQLYGHPWVHGSWPVIAPCFHVTAIDDTGAEHQGEPGNISMSRPDEGSGLIWFWPPVGPQAKQLKITVSTLWEAAWALIDIPGR